MPPSPICASLIEEAKTLNASLTWWVAYRKGLNSTETQQIAEAERTIQLLSEEIAANTLEQAENGCLQPPQNPLYLYDYDPSGIQVSHSESPNQARAESDIAANPKNPLQIVGASKKFRDIHTYDFWLAAYSTSDGGSTWHEMEFPPPPPVDDFNAIIAISDPTVMWDDSNRVYAAGSAFGNLGSQPGDKVPLNPATGLGIAIYRSTDGGLSWPESIVLQSKNTVPTSDTAGNDDKMWPAFNPVTREMMFAWGFSPMIIAKTKTDEWSWEVRAIVDESNNELDGYAVAITALKDGSLAIAWLEGDQVSFGRSAFPVGDPRWNAFHITTPASGFESFDNFPSGGSFPHFPPASFRIESMVSMASEADLVYLAWDSKESDTSATIRYNYSVDGGVTWHEPTKGTPLVTPNDGQYLFQPQVAIGGEFGGIAISYYLFDAATAKIDVYVTATLRPGGVWQTVKLTQYPWDPKVDAILQHGVHSFGLTFVGDYFGLAQCSRGFYPLWMDTRTGIAEMYTARVDFHRNVTPPGGGGGGGPRPPLFKP